MGSRKASDISSEYSIFLRFDSIQASLRLHIEAVRAGELHFSCKMQRTTEAKPPLPQTPVHYQFVLLFLESR